MTTYSHGALEVGYPEEDGGDMIGYVYCERARIYEL